MDYESRQHISRERTLERVRLFALRWKRFFDAVDSIMPKMNNVLLQLKSPISPIFVLKNELSPII
jgi:hypothetical protein